jgi:hypothetical protein
MATAAMGKQMPAEEVLPVQDSKHEDEARRDKVAKAMLSPTVPHTAKSVSMASEAGYDPNGSVWDQWLATQKAKADGSLSMKSRVQSARRPRPNTARSDISTTRLPDQFNSKLATASGYTNLGPEATKARKMELAKRQMSEQQEIEDLKEILGRTLYTGGGNSYKRAGDVATATLQKLDDGQNDDVAILRARRVKEEQDAAVATGRAPWDSTAYNPCPPALKGCKPITPEPWARDAAAYEAGMNSHGFKQIDTGIDNASGGYTQKKKVSIENLSAQIQNDMAAYRRELGAGKKAPVSARHLRAWSDAGNIPPTPKGGRLTGRGASARASARKPAPPAANASARADRIKARSPTKES